MYWPDLDCKSFCKSRLPWFKSFGVILLKTGMKSELGTQDFGSGKLIDLSPISIISWQTESIMHMKSLYDIVTQDQFRSVQGPISQFPTEGCCQMSNSQKKLTIFLMLLSWQLPSEMEILLIKRKESH